MSITSINNSATALLQKQIAEMANAGGDGDADIQGDGTGKIAAGDAAVIQGASLLVNDTPNVGRNASTGKVGGTAKAIDLNEVPQLDPKDVRGLSEIVEDLEKLLAELKNDSTEKQIAATKERIKNLKSKLDSQFKERLDKIDETMQKLDDAAALRKAQQASAWTNIALAFVGAIVAIVAAVVTVATCGAGVGILIGAAAVIGAIAATASAGLSLYQQLDKDGIEQDIKDKAAKYREQGLSQSEARKKATEDVNNKFVIASAVLSVVAIGCGLVGGFANAAGSAARVLTSIQGILAGVGTGGGMIGLIISDKANDANYDAQATQAELTTLEAVLARLQKKLDEETKQVQALIQELMSSMVDITKLLASATDTTNEIAQKIGATA